MRSHEGYEKCPPLFPKPKVARSSLARTANNSMTCEPTFEILLLLQRGTLPLRTTARLRRLPQLASHQNSLVAGCTAWYPRGAR